MKIVFYVQSQSERASFRGAFSSKDQIVACANLQEFITECQKNEPIDLLFFDEFLKEQFF